MGIKGFFQFKIVTNVLASSFCSGSFEYLCYGANILIIEWGDRFYMSESDV